MTIGKFLDFTPEEARKAAQRLAKGSNGSDDQWVAINRERALVKAEKGRSTVLQIWQRYRDGGGDLLKSAQGYERLWVNHLCPFFGTMKVADVTVADVERFKATKRATPGAANRALAVLSILFAKAILWGERKGCAPEHPVKGVQRYEEYAKDFHFTEAELMAILRAADGYKTGAASRTTRGRRMERGEEYGLIVRWLIRTGARAGEVLGAKWDQFVPYDEDRLVWTVSASNTKSGKPVTRVLEADLSKRILDWKLRSLAILATRGPADKSRPEWVFPQRKQPGVHIPRVENAWRDIKAAARLSADSQKRGRIHDIRHSAATHMRRHGAGLELIQQQLGHAHFQTTQRYAHVLPARAAEAGELLGRIAQSV